ncbi:MAG: sporulation membrane protein YtaF [Peptostreptococcaceae bacterium]
MLQSLVLVISLCIDTFVTSMAYGADRIKIPFSSGLVINATCSLFLAISLLFGSAIKNFIPQDIAPLISFSLLLILGIYRLFESFFKNSIKKYSNIGHPLTFKLFDFKFVLEIYADEIKADYDNSKLLSVKEAFYLAVALSLDSLTVGFGCSLGSVNLIDAVLLSFFVGALFLILGGYVGRHFAKTVNISISWLSGAMLILLAFMRII